MRLFRAYLGLESPNLSEKMAKLEALRLAAAHLPHGHTTIEARGRWASPTRGIVSEPTLIVEVFAEQGDEIHRAMLSLCAEFKGLAQQDAVILTSTEIDADFI